MPKNELTNIKENSVLVIVGPTASGKSALAIKLALKYNGVIINADASQVYKNIPIISAVPSEKEKALVQHELYEIYEPEKIGTVTEWLDLAVAKIKDVWAKGKIPIVVGGGGFYIENLINGVSPIPETEEKIKIKTAKIFEEGGIEKAYEYLQKIDASGAEMVKPKDTTRVRRAIEIFESTGISIAKWFEKPMIKKLPDADFKLISLMPDIKEIEKKSDLRFDEMMKNGALEEVKKLLALKLDENLPAMKAIGVPELKKYIDGQCSLEEAVSLAKLRTRQYAKRQLTWFRNRLKKLDAEFINSEK